MNAPSLSFVRDWTHDRRARRILASFAKHPPKVEAIPAHERWDRYETRYTGFRVALLRVLRANLLDPLFIAAQAEGNDAATDAIMAQLSVTDAIDLAMDSAAALTAFHNEMEVFWAPLNQITGRVA